MYKVKIVLVFLILGIFLSACGSDRAGSNDSSETNRSNGVLGVVDLDSDNDGLSDSDEIIYGTNPDNNDTDGDGLLDGEEIYIYDSNVTNPDSDGDGLLDGDEVNIYGTDVSNPDTDNDGLADGEEVHRYQTNPRNSDTDGDCLLDSFEILNYETNASNADTDGDRINDGIEIYSDTPGQFDTSCIDVPETLAEGHNPSPVIDNIPDDGTDVINALDPNNDSDGDGQVNSRENNCTGGDPRDKDKVCPYETETVVGNALIDNGYAYIPGGFDVDGDGVDEGGFWISRYQARANKDELISSELIISIIGNVNKYVSKKFIVENRKIAITAYKESALSETEVVAGFQLIFKEEDVFGKDRISSFTPYLAEACLSQFKLLDINNTPLDVNITLPTHKQYVHVKMLLDADKANGGDGRHIRNGLLGVDPNVPLVIDELVIDEFGITRKEFLRNLIQLRETHITERVSIFSLADFSEEKFKWWEVDSSKALLSQTAGASSTQDIGAGIDTDADPYAVVARGGELIDLRYGISGISKDSDGQTNGIGFRAATDYLY